MRGTEAGRELAAAGSEAKGPLPAAAARGQRNRALEEVGDASVVDH